MTDVLVLSHAACGTCKKALRWLDGEGVNYTLRAIVDEPPTAAELATWIAASGRSVRKWLNTSGQSYRALGKAKIDAASDEELVKMLAADGKLVKRPVVVVRAGKADEEGKQAEQVLVGFDEDALSAALRPGS